MRFNPLQVSQKLDVDKEEAKQYLCFNPLQVSQKLGNPKPADNSKECFNPLQVSQKPLVTGATDPAPAWFQSLVGKLETLQSGG